MMDVSGGEQEPSETMEHNYIHVVYVGHIYILVMPLCYSSYACNHHDTGEGGLRKGAANRVTEQILAE